MFKNGGKTYLKSVSTLRLVSKSPKSTLPKMAAKGHKSQSVTKILGTCGLEFGGGPHVPVLLPKGWDDIPPIPEKEKIDALKDIESTDDEEDFLSDDNESGMMKLAPLPYEVTQSLGWEGALCWITRRREREKDAPPLLPLQENNKDLDSSLFQVLEEKNSTNEDLCQLQHL